MKKIFIIFSLFLSPFIFSQTFNLTENNYKLKDDNSKDFIVMSFPGKNKEELFILAKKYISSNYKDLKSEQYREVNNEQIILDVLSQSSRTIFINKKEPNVWRTFNRYEINFKDDKLMIRPTFLNLTNAENNSIITIGNFFNGSGFIRMPNAIEFNEAFTDTFVRNFKDGVQENKTQEW